MGKVSGTEFCRKTRNPTNRRLNDSWLHEAQAKVARLTHLQVGTHEVAARTVLEVFPHEQIKQGARFGTRRSETRIAASQRMINDCSTLVCRTAEQDVGKLRRKNRPSVGIHYLKQRDVIIG